MSDDFDPDQYLNELASQRAGVPSKGVPPMLARPGTPQNAAGLPDYAHDPVPPHQADGTRQAIASVTSQPGFDAKTPDEQRSAIIDAVHSVTRAVGDGANAVVNGAASAVPFGRITGAALASAPGIGNGQGFRQNYDAIGAEQAQSAASHPFLDGLGKVGGGLATVAASGGIPGVNAALGAPAAVAAPAAGGALVRGLAPVAAGGVAGGAQATAGALAEGSDATDVLKRGLTGTVTGATIGASVPVASKALGSLGNLFKGAMSRSDERILGYVGDSAPKKMREKINEKAAEVVDVVRAKFGDTYKDPKAFVKDLGDHVSSVGNQTQHIYGEAQSTGGTLDPKPIMKAMKAAQGSMGFDEKEIAGALDEHIGKFSDRLPGARSQQDILEHARAGLQAGKPAGVIRGELANGIPLDEARREVTRLQTIAFDKLDATLTTPKREAAARAANILKDALERHVEQTLGPEAGATVRDLNAQQTVLLRLEAAAQEKAINSPNLTGTRLSKVVKENRGATALAIGAGKEVAGVADEGLARLGRAGGDKIAQKVSSAISPSEFTQKLTTKLAATANHGEARSAIMDYVFGGNAARTVGNAVTDTAPEDDQPAYTPVQFGTEGAK